MGNINLLMRLVCSYPKTGKAAYLDGCILGALGLKDKMYKQMLYVLLHLILIYKIE